MKKKEGRGRPTLNDLNVERIRIKICLTLYQGEDDDLIDWFNSIPSRKKARYVKKALRAGGMTEAEPLKEHEEFISDNLLDDFLSTL